MSEKVFQKINELIERGETFAVATIVRTGGSTPRGPGAKMVVLKDGSTFGSVGGDCAERGVVAEALEALEEEEPRVVSMSLEEEEKGGVGMRCGGKIEVSIEVVQPSPKLIITGGGRIAAKVAELGQRVGFSVTVVDPFAKEGEFPEGAKIVAKPVEQGMRELKITPQTFIAIITRHKYDEPALKAALDSGASYIGMMGSRDRVKSVFETLRKEGIREEKFSRVHAPIGLDIGAETPDEIAVSIIAEIIKGRRRPEASGKSLKISA
jgi:xanthine dehydrogenase accessory factor